MKNSPSGSLRDQEPAKFDWARAAALAAIFMAVALVIAKGAAWFMTGSVAVLGSFADSALDLLGSVGAGAAIIYAALPPDMNHRFGHQKAEALTGMAQVALLSASAALVAWESVKRLLNPAPLENGEIAIWVLAASLVATTALVAFQSVAIRRTGSLIIKGDRAHYMGDMLANAGALAAVFIGHNYGFVRADAIAGLIAAVFLATAGYQVARSAIPQLMDEELPSEDQNTIRQILEDDDDVYTFHALRTRRAGGRRFIQLDIQIDPDLSFREAHDITDRVELALEQAFSDADVIVHPDPVGEARLERRVIEEQRAAE